jgi:radical SAM-linked protein
LGDAYSESADAPFASSGGVIPEATARVGSQKDAVALIRYRASFSKGDKVKYLSHLDLTRALPRAFRRASVRLGYSQGFHPMPLIQYGPALGVGVGGENELLDFDSFDELEEPEFLSRMNASLPEGLRFKSLNRLPAGSKTLIKEVNRAEYEARLDAAEIVAAVQRMRELRPEFAEATDIEIHERLIEEFIARDSLVIERARRDKRQTVDVRRYTVRVSVQHALRVLTIVTELSASGAVKPVEVVGAIYGLDQQEMLALNSRVRRTRLYFESEASGQVSFASQAVASSSASV